MSSSIADLYNIDEVVFYPSAAKNVEKFDITWAWDRIKDVPTNWVENPSDIAKHFGHLHEDMDVRLFINDDADTPMYDFHEDEESVLLICTYGSVLYAVIINNMLYTWTLQVGDILQIPAGVTHRAFYTGEPRVVISIGWYHKGHPLTRTSSE